MLTNIALERGYKAGWASHKYKEKFGAWPAWGARPEPIPPTPEVRIMGALAPDCLREGKAVGMKKRKSATTHKIVGQFAPRTIAMLRSPAFRALSLSGHRILGPHRDRARQPWRQG